MTEKRRRAAAVRVALAAVLAWVSAAREELLEVLGIGMIVTGVAMWSVPVAFIVAGVSVLLIVHPPLPARWRR